MRFYSSLTPLFCTGSITAEWRQAHIIIIIIINNNNNNNSNVLASKNSYYRPNKAALPQAQQCMLYLFIPFAAAASRGTHVQ